MISRAICGSSPGSTLSTQRRGSVTAGFPGGAATAFVAALTAARVLCWADFEREGDAVGVISPPKGQVPSRYPTDISASAPEIRCYA
jgi:hypothetical protein